MHEHTALCAYAEEMYQLLKLMQKRDVMNKQVVEWFIDLLSRIDGQRGKI